MRIFFKSTDTKQGTCGEFVLTIRKVKKQAVEPKNEKCFLCVQVMLKDRLKTKQQSYDFITFYIQMLRKPHRANLKSHSSILPTSNRKVFSVSLSVI